MEGVLHVLIIIIFIPFHDVLTGCSRVTADLELLKASCECNVFGGIREERMKRKLNKEKEAHKTNKQNN